MSKDVMRSGDKGAQRPRSCVSAMGKRTFMFGLRLMKRCHWYLQRKGSTTPG